MPESTLSDWKLRVLRDARDSKATGGHRPGGRDGAPGSMGGRLSRGYGELVDAGLAFWQGHYLAITPDGEEALLRAEATEAELRKLGDAS